MAQSIDSKWFAGGTDCHVFFRAGFELDRRMEVSFRIFGAHWFKVWLDGEFLSEGPLRFCETRPEYEVFRRELEPGRHVLAWHAHQMNIATRLIGSDVVPCVHAVVRDAEDREIVLDWKALEPGAWRATGRRLGCVLGWVEWCDRRKLPEGWKLPEFSDAGWDLAGDVSVSCESFEQARLGNLRRPIHEGTLIGSGELVNMSIIDHDPTSGFFIRELENHTLPTQGRWWRFDLGRVRLGYPVLRARTKPGTIIQVAYAESLTFGRVHPYLKTGGGVDSCMLDHWVSAGGTEELVPLHPKGARFVEIHMIGPGGLDPEGFSFEERVYFSEESEGAFSCGDALLDRAWAVGRDTFVACSEDCVTDNPHRERGQWLGEAEAPCIELLSVCYSDWRILRRSLEQAALCASPEGLLPAVYPGTREYIPSFAIQWVKAMLDYVRHTGDRSLLDPLHAAAEKNLEVFQRDVCGSGLLVNPAYWNFIDWGYRGASTVFLKGAQDVAAADPALSLFYLEAMESLAHWSEWIGKSERAAAWGERAGRMRGDLRRAVEAVEREGAWGAYGYHATTLSLRCGLVTRTGDAVEFLKRFLLSCFPNDPGAPRLSDVTVEAERIMTSYFAHFSFPVLAEHGAMDFVLAQIRTCWGWMLEQGWTTWAELFDPRWSHCHYWSGTPTWMLTRCGLGLTPSFERGIGCYNWTFRPGGLKNAKGRIPLPSLDGENPGHIEISWEKQADDRCRFSIQSPIPLKIRHGGGEEIVPASTVCQFLPGLEKGRWTLPAS